MAVPTITKRLQTWIVASSALGIFAVGVIVAVAGIVPLYGHLKNEEERNLTLVLHAKIAAVQEYLARARDIAVQIASRTNARQILEQYNSGKISLDEASRLSAPVLLDAAGSAPEVWGITRYDPTGRVVVQVGLDLPETVDPVIADQEKDATCSGPVILDHRPFLLVKAPILDRNAERVGTDVVLFRLSKLERMLKDYSGLGATGDTLIGEVQANLVELVFSFRDSQAKVAHLSTPLGEAIRRAATLKRTGIIFPDPSSYSDEVIVFGPVKGAEWGMALKIDSEELYAPVKRYILATCHLILLLILLGTLGMVLLVRPLTGKMIIRADELEKEVAEKTEILQRELAGRKRMEQWLMDSERRYRTLLEEVPDVIFILDNEGRFIYINTQIERFLEHTVSEILETILAIHVAPEDRERAQDIFRLEPEMIWDEEIAMLDSHGLRKFARIRCKAIKVDNEPIRFEGVMRDITRRRRLEEELKNSREELLEKIRIIDDLYEHIVQSGRSKAIADHTAEVAHELRQPLAIIGGFARRLAKQFDSCGTEQDSSRKESCSIMIGEIQRLERILTSLIEFTRHGSLRLESVDPNELIERVLHVHQSRIQDKDLRLYVNLAREVGEIPLDPNRFEQVIRNLLSNAIEASPPGEAIRVETGVFVASGKAQETGGLESEGYFEMKIRNEGKIIPPDDLKKIFSPFYTTKDYGTGIGLTICRRIVEDHKGSISAKSDHEGTVFTVWAPLHHSVTPAVSANVASDA